MRLFLFSIVITFLTSFSSTSTEKIIKENRCNVIEFYEAIQPDYGVKVLTLFGSLENAELILVPAKIKEGVYEIKISHKASNLYKLEGTKYYIETGFCYDFSFYNDGLLKVENNYGYTKGTVYFD